MRNPFLYINNARIRGIDYEALWNKETDVFGNRPENLTLRFLAGRLLEDSTTTPTGAVADFAGELGEPGFRALLSARWQIGGFGVMLQERYLGESGINPTNPQSSGTITFIQFEPGRVPGPGQLTVDDATVESKAYTDLTFSYDRDLSDGKAWQVALAITNLLDENPPTVPVFDQRFSSQSNPAGFNAYDVYGRRYLLSFNYRL